MNEDQGKSVVVTITDRCAGCFIAQSLGELNNYRNVIRLSTISSFLDFSPAAFNMIADPAVGRIHDIEWEFV
jgi:hypothetical protein